MRKKEIISDGADSKSIRDLINRVQLDMAELLSVVGGLRDLIYLYSDENLENVDKRNRAFDILTGVTEALELEINVRTKWYYENQGDILSEYKTTK